MAERTRAPYLGDLSPYRNDGLESVLTTTATKISAYTTAANQLVPVDATGGAITITLPAAATAGKGAEVVVKKIDASTNAVTVARSSPDTINAALTTISIKLPDEALTFVSDGTSKWSIAAGQKSLSSLDKRYTKRGDMVLNVADYCAYDGVTDDSAAFQALLDSIPAAAGNEIGGAHLYFPHGVLLLNTPTSGVLAKLSAKPNVKLSGTGAGSRIRTTTATATELLKAENCTGLVVEDLLFQVIGTANVEHALHYTTTSPGSSHDAQIRGVKASCNGTYRRAYDVSTTSGSPTIYSAMAAFAAGDVGGSILLMQDTAPLFTTITAVATLTGVLATDIDATTTTVTLNAAITGAPASGYTIKIDTERMSVTAGGNTTTLTVTRRRGPDLVSSTHAAGAAVTTYRATLAVNATDTVSNSVVGARIVPAGQAVMQNGITIAATPTGVGNLDVAGTSLVGVQANGAALAGIRVGNGTPANILDQYAAHLSAAECGIGVYLHGGSLAVRSGQMSTNLVDFRRGVSASSPIVIDGVRSEGSMRFYEMTGQATAGPSVTMIGVNIATVNAEDGVVIRHLNSAPMVLINMQVKSSDVAQGTVLVVASGTSGAPCHLSVHDFASSGGNLDPFSSSVAPATVKTLTGIHRIGTTGVISTNSALATYFGGRVEERGGRVGARTAVADAAYTVLASDEMVAYTTLTAARVVTLPAQSASLPAPQQFVIKDESGNCDGTKTITITPPAGTIDGAASLVLNTAYARAQIYTNGTNWFTR